VERVDMVAQESKKTPTRYDVLISQMNKKFGVGSVKTLQEDDTATITHWGTTGIYNLDDATGWGLPGGRIVEYFGPESSGKTTALMAAMIANAERGGLNVICDAEHTFDQDRYQEMGGDPEALITMSTGTLEEFYDKLKVVVSWAGKQEIPNNALVLIGVDSIPMILTKRQMEVTGDEMTVGQQAAVNARHLPNINDNLPENTCLVLLNQVRDKIGAMAFTAEGNIDTPCGRVIKHLASIRVLFMKAGQLDNGKSGDKRQILGMKTTGKVVKNKVAPPLRKAPFNIMFDERGVDNVQVILSVALSHGWLIKGKGGLLTLKKLKSEVTCVASTFAEVLQKRPKWAKAMLADCFTMEQHLPDLSRYIGKAEPEEKDEEDN
jgi:recombination protein RecA